MVRHLRRKGRGARAREEGEAGLENRSTPPRVSREDRLLQHLQHLQHLRRRKVAWRARAGGAGARGLGS